MKKWILTAVLGSLALSSPSISAELKKTAPVGMNFLEQSSEAFTKIADQAMPATVFIKAQIAQQNPEYLNPFEMYGDDFFRKFFGFLYRIFDIGV